MTSPLALLAISLSLSFLTWTSALAGSAGTVIRSAGTVSIQSIDGTSRAASVNETVNEGERIITDRGGEALIRFKDNSAMTLRPGTQVVISQFKHEDTDADSFVATLLKGALRSVSGLIGKAKPNNVHLHTPTATIGIRGTDFEIAILPEDGPDGRAGTYNYVYEGITSLGLKNQVGADDARSIDVKPEETGLALANPRPGEPALQILKQRPAFLRGGGLDAHMMQISAQPMRAIQLMPRR